jgi:hypothetical protein
VAKITLKRIKSFVKENKLKTCACFDVWSDRSHSTYLGGTLHTLSDKFDSGTFFVGVHRLKNGTAADQIRDGCEALLSRIGLSLDSIDFLVTDNGSNIVSALKNDFSGNIF